MSWQSFVHQAQPTRVVFGAGQVASVADEVTRLGLRRVLVVGGGSAVGLAKAMALALDVTIVAMPPT